MLDDVQNELSKCRLYTGLPTISRLARARRKIAFRPWLAGYELVRPAMEGGEVERAAASILLTVR